LPICPETVFGRRTSQQRISVQEDFREVHMMISHVAQKHSAWLIDSSLVTTLGLPPKDAHGDDDENEDDEESDDEEGEEPAVIREPDEC
jgi:hypothetical protein